MMLGVVAGATLRGDLRPVEAGFHAAFIGPWASPFCFSVGFFTCVLFAFLAAVYLIGETMHAELRAIYVRRALLSNALAVLTGALVFVAAEFEGLELMRLFGARVLSLASMGGATLILAPLWIAIGRNAVHSARILVAAQVGMVLIGWFRLQYPAIINSRIDPLTIYSAAAPEPALRYLLYALVAGSIIIFPARIYLLAIFKLGETDRAARSSAPR